MPRTQSIVKAMLVTGIIALGIGAAWCTVAGWSLGLIIAAFQEREDYEQLLVTMTGEPVIVRTSRHAGVDEQFHDLMGQAVKTTRQGLLYPQYLQHPDQMADMNMRDWSYRITGANDGGTPAVYWYLIHDGRPNGRAHGVGYHAKSNLIVGYFGRSGFRDTPPPAEDGFVIRGNQCLYGAVAATNTYMPGFWRSTDSLLPLLADQKLYVIDVAKRQVKVLLDCPSGQQLGAVWRLPKEVPPPNPDEVSQQAQIITPSDVLIRQPDSVVVVNQRNGDHATFPLPPDCRHSMLSPFLLGDRSLLLVASDLDHWRNGDDLIWIAPTGEVLKREHIRLSGHVGGESEAAMGWLVAAVVPAPVGSVTVAALAPLGMIRSRQAETYAARVRKTAV